MSAARRFAGPLVHPLTSGAPTGRPGTGADLNKATQNGLERAAALFGKEVPEIKNRATITGAIEIGRAPGVVTVTMRAPVSWLEKIGLLDVALEQYGEHFEMGKLVENE